MTPRDFTNWLQGYLDALETPLSEPQLAKVKTKLGTVIRVDPALSSLWPHTYINTNTTNPTELQTF